MRNRAIIIVLATLAACSRPPSSQTETALVPSAVASDPAVDPKFPAGNEVFTIPVGDGAMNAMMYTASGPGPHPTLLLLHGFPGNEQNLDLAQAARRAGWNVLTQHYRGTWGSKGGFTFRGAAEDASAALGFLQLPANAARFRIDPRRIAIAGHSMGGMMAADAAAREPKVIGIFLIDPWDISETAKTLDTPEGRKEMHDEIVTDLPALQGTSEAKLLAELRANGGQFDLAARLAEYGNRPLEILGAQRGGGKSSARLLQAAKANGNRGATGEVWPTDHSFNDHRVALANRLVLWLEKLAGTKR